MPKTSIRIKLVAGAVVGAAFWAARRAAYAPPDEAVAARAHDATRSGPWRHNYATVNGVRLHYAELGSGPLVILLHGFPQCWYQWRYVIPRLAEHFHVVAPDMRGYNESDKPPGIASYTIKALTQDVASLIEALGEERAHIVGHDWGGGVAWGLSMMHAPRVDRLVVLNSPHPAAFERELKKGRQMLRSWYILFFQLPLLPEVSMRLNLRRSLPNSAQVPGAFPEEALDVYENALAQPGAATAMINYYRAVFRNAPAARTLVQPVTRPTLLLWGMKDFALVSELTEGLEEWVPDLRIERVEESGHWLAEEKPGVVVDALLDFLLN
jgi:pimeloyl-ACP methyl ester carboxylesterase